MVDMIATEDVHVKEGLINDVIGHAIESADRGGYECVGFLAARKGKRKGELVGRIPLHNHSADPHTGFFVEPWEQYRAEKQLDDAGLEVVGIYHSHPLSQAHPSMMDEAMAREYRPGELMMIYSVAYGEIACFREEAGRLHKVNLIYT